MPFKEVERLFREEFGVPWQQLFQSIEVRQEAYSNKTYSSTQRHRVDSRVRGPLPPYTRHGSLCLSLDMIFWGLSYSYLVSVSCAYLDCL